MCNIESRILTFKYTKTMTWRPDVAAMLALGIPRVLILICYLLSCSSQFDSSLN